MPIIKKRSHDPELQTRQRSFESYGNGDNSTIDSSERPREEKKTTRLTAKIFSAVKETRPCRHEIKFVNKNQYFADILEKAQKLARVFNGAIKTEKSFSICKGNNSIRFNCQNEHNFYLSAEIISSIDIDEVKKQYKESRLQLEAIFEGK